MKRSVWCGLQEARRSRAGRGCVGVPAALATCWRLGEAWAQSRRQSGLWRRLWAQEHLLLH